MKHIETIKTIMIAVLLSGIVAFIAGVRYQKSLSLDAIQTTTPQKAVQESKK